MDDEQASVERAHAFLRANTRADLRFDEHFRPVRYVIAPDDGRLVMPVMVAMLQTLDTVLFIPEVVEEAMELQVTLERFDEHGPDGALADRWRIHHGEPDDVNWAFGHIDAARHEGVVIDGDPLMRPNPLRADEPAICKHMNAEHADALRRLCFHYADIEVESPVMVAIDPHGIDVRGRFDVIRVPAIEPMHSAEDARRVLKTMTERAAAEAGGTADHG
jgi:hypothetical protein